MNFILVKRLIIIIVTVFVGLFCNQEIGPTSGGTSETTNGISASIIDQDGVPVKGAIVRLRRNDFITEPSSLTKQKVFAVNANTDNQGKFRIEGIDSGIYHLEINNGNSAIMFVCTLGTGEIIDLGINKLHAYASIVGTVGSLKSVAYIQVYGLERLVQVNTNGRFLIDNLPPGRLNLRIVNIGDTQTTTHLESIEVRSAETTKVITAPYWRFMKHLYLSTTVNGAAVSQNVYDFSLLVRLTASNFDFSQARDSGQDIRFVNQHGAFLPYEVERWDRTGSKAEIWVHIDTVYGNNDRQYITMMWGNPDASSQNSGEMVFDTSNGFAGVWHLNNDPSKGVSAIRDASNLSQNATAHGSMSSGNLMIGVIGECLSFDGFDDYLYTHEPTPITLGSDPVSLCAWVKLSSGDNAILSARGVNGKESRRLRLRFLNGMLRFGEIDISNHDSTYSWIENKSLEKYSFEQWRHVTVVFERGKKAIGYIDGIAVDSIDLSSHIISLDEAFLQIGYDEFAPESYASGLIDEVRFMRKVINPSIIKLTFMNQRPDDRLLR